MSNQSRRTDYSHGTDPRDAAIETTIPAKKPAADLPTDEFFTRTSYRPINATGAASDALAGRVEGVHLFGGLHGDSRTVDRLFDAIRRYTLILSLSKPATKRSTNTSQNDSTSSGRLSTKSKRQPLPHSTLTACRLPESTYHPRNDPERVGTSNSSRLMLRSSRSLA